MYEPADGQLPIGAATYQALFKFGVVDRLQHLPMQFGPIDRYEEAVLLPAGLQEAAGIVRGCAANIGSGQEYDFLVANQIRPLQIEYRLKSIGRQLISDLEALALFFDRARAARRGVRLWL